MTQVNLSVSFVKVALSARSLVWPEALLSHFTGISIDSRQVQPGDLFVAIKGAKLDGHAFLWEACAKGALAAIVASSIPIEAKAKLCPLIGVDDTLLALQDLAKNYLQTLPARRVALTGSSGKTSTKELIRTVCVGLYGEEAVLATRGNLNNHIGVPLMAFELQPQHKVAIFEMGMNAFGEIAALARIVKAQIGLVTNMGSAHAGKLGGLDGVAKAKAELFEALGVQDIAIVNADDPRSMREAAQKVVGRKITFGQAPFADFRIEEVVSDADKTECRLSYKDQSAKLSLPLLGVHQAMNAASAVAVAVALGEDFQRSVQALSKAKPIKGRLMPHLLKDNILLLDDAYNANPESLKVGLSALQNYKSRRHIVVLGDMKELGEHAASMHAVIGAACAQQHVAKLFACGELASYYIEGARRAGFAQEDLVHAADSETLAPLVKAALKPGDVVLIKGSLSMNMAFVVNFLLGQLSA